jgi:hypothetical protein
MQVRIDREETHIRKQKWRQNKYKKRRGKRKGHKKNETEKRRDNTKLKHKKYEKRE